MSSNMSGAIGDALRAHWRMFLFQGVVMLVLGVLAVIAPVSATFAVDVFIGWLFLISGATGLVAMFSANDLPAFLWTMLTAALSITIGVLLIWKPSAGAASLTILLTVFFIAEGMFQIAASIAYRTVIPGSWGWMVFSGVADFILAAVILLGWPGSATWALGLLVGVNLITSGTAIVFTAIEGRNAVNSLVGATA